MSEEKPKRGGSSKGAGGSKLFGIILIIIGALIVTIGLAALFGINIFTTLGIPDIVGVLGWSEIVIGAWGFVAGVGLLQSQEWGYHRRRDLLLPYGGSP